MENSSNNCIDVGACYLGIEGTSSTYPNFCNVLTHLPAVVLLFARLSVPCPALSPAFRDTIVIKVTSRHATLASSPQPPAAGLLLEVGRFSEVATPPQHTGSVVQYRVPSKAHNC